MALWSKGLNKTCTEGGDKDTQALFGFEANNFTHFIKKRNTLYRIHIIGLSLISYKQLRSYGDGATNLSLPRESMVRFTDCLVIKPATPAPTLPDIIMTKSLV